MADVVETARKKLAELEAQAAELRTFLQVHARLSGAEAVDYGGNDSPEEGEPGTASPAEIVDSALAVMREQQKPMTRTRLVKVLTAKGLKLPGKDKAKNIGTVIWRSKRFDNLAGEGYWPVGWPPPTRRHAEPDLLEA